MPPYQIVVGYDPSATPQWTITPCALHIPETATFPLQVSMTQAAGANWTFDKVLGLNAPQWTIAVAPDGKSVALTETGASQRRNAYQVRINANGGKVVSPNDLCRASTPTVATNDPPMIINDGSMKKTK